MGRVPRRLFRCRFGGESPTPDQIRALQAELKPILLRRMKEDVEDLPEKEEILVWVGQDSAHLRPLGGWVDARGQGAFHGRHFLVLADRQLPPRDPVCFVSGSRWSEAECPWMMPPLGSAAHRWT